MLLCYFIVYLPKNIMKIRNENNSFNTKINLNFNPTLWLKAPQIWSVLCNKFRIKLSFTLVNRFP